MLFFYFKEVLKLLFGLFEPNASFLASFFSLNFKVVFSFIIFVSFIIYFYKKCTYKEIKYIE